MYIARLCLKRRVETLYIRESYSEESDSGFELVGNFPMNGSIENISNLSDEVTARNVGFFNDRFGVEESALSFDNRKGLVSLNIEQMPIGNSARSLSFGLRTMALSLTVKMSRKGLSRFIYLLKEILTKI